MVEWKKTISETPSAVSSSLRLMMDCRCRSQIGQPAYRRNWMWIRDVFESAMEMVSPLKVVKVVTSKHSGNRALAFIFRRFSSVLTLRSLHIGITASSQA